MHEPGKLCKKKGEIEGLVGSDEHKDERKVPTLCVAKQTQEDKKEFKKKDTH